MKFGSSLFLVIILSGTLFGVAILFPNTHANEFETESSNAVTVIKDNLQITIESDKKTYFENDTLFFRWTFKNIGDKPVEYYHKNSCDDGTGFNIINTQEKIRGTLLPNGASQITKDDSKLNKFDSIKLYSEILDSIQKNKDEKFSLIISSSDNDKLEELLKEKHHATNVSSGKKLHFTTAMLSAQEILKIADYDLVRSIGEGGRESCEDSIVDLKLYPDQSIYNEIYWGQYLHSYDENLVKQTESDNYAIVVGMNTDNSSTACLSFDIVDKQHEISNAFDCSEFNKTPNTIILSDDDLKSDAMLIKWHAELWLDARISNDEYLQKLESFVNKNMSKHGEPLEEQAIEIESIPSWIKYVTAWWVDEKINDEEYFDIVQYVIGIKS